MDKYIAGFLASEILVFIMGMVSGIGLDREQYIHLFIAIILAVGFGLLAWYNISNYYE